MKKVCVIGAGIVGSTAAFYLSEAGFKVDVYDEGVGQATTAAVGIICPWVSQRRNKEWYQLVEDGAIFYHQLIQDLKDDSFYTKSGSLHLHNNLEKLEAIAVKRSDSAKVMGNIEILKGDELKPYLLEGVKVDEALLIDGAACVDGKTLVEILLDKAKNNGATLSRKRVILDPSKPNYVDGVQYDAVFVCVGAWINQVFSNYDVDIDVYPQKGQLIEYPGFFDVDQGHYPFIIPQGELDIMFDMNGSLVIGASHEKEKGFELEVDDSVSQRLHQEALEYLPFLKDKHDYKVRVGTRAHSSDFNPFYGKFPEADNIYVASALGSSGLTSGPIIGYRLAQGFINQTEVEQATDTSRYIKKSTRV